MSARLLRRAAKELREVVDGLDSEQQASWAGLCRTWFVDGPPVGAFVATVSPPAALALAAWFDATADAVDQGDALNFMETDDAAIGTARAILREGP